MSLDKIDIAFVTQLLRVRRLVSDQTQTRDAAAFLIDRDDRLDFAQIAQIIDELSQLRSARDVATEKNKRAWLHFSKQLCRFGIEFLAGNPSHDQLTKRIAFHTFRNVDVDPARGKKSTFNVLKIAIYGGTFDPIHHAHLILARQAVEQLGLDEVRFVPAGVSPFKTAPVATGDLRLSMLRAAIKGERNFTVDDCEIRRPPPSYTTDTVKEIGRRETGAEIYYLIGQDNVTGLERWHRFAELKKMVRFVVLDRTGDSANHPYQVIRRRIDISATEIRKRVASGESIRYLVPAAVEEIIRREKLYREQAK